MCMCVCACVNGGRKEPKRIRNWFLEQVGSRDEERMKISWAFDPVGRLTQSQGIFD